MEASAPGRGNYGLKYGDVDGIARLIEKMVNRDDIGAVLVDGILSASREWGLEELAIHVKGLEPAGYDPRVLKVMGSTGESGLLIHGKKEEAPLKVKKILH